MPTASCHKMLVDRLNIILRVIKYRFCKDAFDSAVSQSELLPIVSYLVQLVARIGDTPNYCLPRVV
eukprot:6186844-Pleurochrysis_carterae.AAC.1